jgi:hypothetical protein
MRNYLAEGFHRPQVLPGTGQLEPNFGDYTDDLVVGKFLYTAWADGRLSDPQPFFARLGG